MHLNCGRKWENTHGGVRAGENSIEGMKRELKEENKNYILIDERNGIELSGFDYGNLPSQIKNIDFTEKTVVHTTSCGTQGIINAVNAEEIEKLKLSSGKKFFDKSEQDVFQKEDFYLCTEINKFKFILKVKKDKNVKIIYYYT